jgi:hypothetical protein
MTLPSPTAAELIRSMPINYQGHFVHETHDFGWLYEETRPEPAWLLERTGFEPSRPFDSTVWSVVSIPLAMNWPHFLVADA